MNEEKKIKENIENIEIEIKKSAFAKPCLLYTSDAADE